MMVWKAASPLPVNFGRKRKVRYGAGSKENGRQGDAQSSLAGPGSVCGLLRRMAGLRNAE